MSFMILTGDSNEPVFFDSFNEAVSSAKTEAQQMFEEGYLGECVVYEAAMVASVTYKPTFEVKNLYPQSKP